MKTELEQFTRAYIEAALWSSTDGNDEPLDSNYGRDDISTEALGIMGIDCNAFFQGYYDLIKSNASQAGHDFWLTRNHHGCGFFDGDWGLNGDYLTEQAHGFGEQYMYIGDDGKIYVS